MKYREQIEAWIEAHRAEMLEDIKTLCRIDSSKGKAVPAAQDAPESGMPFGEGPYKALKAAEKMIMPAPSTAPPENPPPGPFCPFNSTYTP